MSQDSQPEITLMATQVLTFTSFHQVVRNWAEQHETSQKGVLKGMSNEQNKTKLNYILVGRLCNPESP
jgi:hypothetical protein